MKKVVLMVIFLLAFSIFITVLIGDISEDAEIDNIRYTLHSPIRINGDADFDNAHGVVSGSGTENDPYLISGWNIDANGKEAAIYIGNTTKYFKIYNCYLSHAQGGSGFIPVGYGIEIYNAANGVIEYVTSVYNQNYGIYIHESENIKVTSSTLYSNGVGSIYVYSSTDITISGNRMNKYIGITSSDTVNVTANTLTSEDIFVSSASHIYIANNHIKDVKGDAIYLSSVSYSKTQNNSIMNADIGIYVSSSIRDNEISGNEISQANNSIYIYSSRNIRIKNNTLEENGKESINVSQSSSIIITGNILSNETNRSSVIRLYKSDGNLITENVVRGNSSANIIIDTSDQNIIQNNDINTGYITFYNSDKNKINNNTIDNGGIKLYYSSENYIEGNEISNCYYGVYLYLDSMYNVVSSNKIYDYFLGIYVERSSNNTIVNNVIEKGHATYSSGIDISISNYTLVENNTVSGAVYGLVIEDYSSNYNKAINNTLFNNEYGIWLYALNTTVVGNEMKDNEIGMLVWLLINNTVEKNKFIHNTYGIDIYTAGYEKWDIIGNNTYYINHIGIYVEYTYSHVIIEDGFFFANAYGIYFDDSGYFQVKNNTFQSNGYGIYLDNSVKNVITGNKINYSTYYGIYAKESSENLIYNNTFYHNNGASDTYDPAKIQAYDDGENHWNSTELGNYWSDWSSPDEDGDGFVDIPYFIEGGDAKDYLPIALSETPIPEISTIPIILLVFIAIIILRRKF